MSYKPSEDDVSPAANAMRAALGVEASATFHGAFEDADGMPVAYVGEDGAIFDDYAQWALETIGPIIESERLEAYADGFSDGRSEGRDERGA